MTGEEWEFQWQMGHLSRDWGSYPMIDLGQGTLRNQSLKACCSPQRGLCNTRTFYVRVARLKWGPRGSPAVDTEIGIERDRPTPEGKSSVKSLCYFPTGRVGTLTWGDRRRVFLQ